MLYQVGYLCFVFAVKTPCRIKAGLAVFLMNDIVLAQIFQHFFHSFFQSQFLSIDIIHKQTGDIVHCCREQQLVILRKVAYHKQYVDNALPEVAVFVFLNHPVGILYGLLPLGHQSTFEHRAEELVKRDELANFFIFCLFSRAMSNLNDGAFVSFDFLFHESQLDERIEYLHDQPELIRHKRIIVYEFLPVVKSLVRGWQLKLCSNSIAFAVIQLTEFDACCPVFFKNTFLRDVFRFGSGKRYLYFKTSHNLAIIFACRIDLAALQNFLKILLGGRRNPYFIFTSLMQTRYNFLQLEQQPFAVVNKLTDFID